VFPKFINPTFPAIFELKEIPKRELPKEFWKQELEVSV
jgi:hypothetical protein